MKRFQLGSILLISGIVLLVTAYTLMTALYVNTPGNLKEADFMAFYSVGRVGRDHGLARVYDLELEASTQAQISGLPLNTTNFLPPNHPPFLYPLISLLAGLDYTAAYFGYALLLIVLVVIGLPAVYSLLRQNGWPRIQSWVVLTGILLFEPLFISILKGQDSALLLLGGLLWFCGVSLNDDRLAGLGLSLTLIRPQVAIVLALPFLIHRRKVFGWFCAGGLALGLYSFLQVGWSGTRDFLHLLALSVGGEGYGMTEQAMFNFTGLVLRLAPHLDIGLIHTLGWGLFATAIIALSVIWGRSKSINHHDLALAVSLSLFTAPHLHYHDLALLVVPLLGLVLVAGKAGKLKLSFAAGLPIIVSVVFLFGEWWDPLRLTFPYLLMAALPILTWLLEKRSDTNKKDFSIDPA